ncbi:MAG: redox-sensing transcriptional repressor Rex [Lentisphaeria bacterium]|nr:redox-sensing transcriptional repressor Rex [Lentisphaeria bacterium]
MGRLKIQRTPTIRRMPTYLHKLCRMRQEGKTYVSCTELAEYMNIELIVARKDIAMTGLAGHRRYGYRIDELIEAIREYVGWDKGMSAVLVGAGALGSALLGYQDFATYGLSIDFVFDSSPAKIGTLIHEHEVFDIAEIHCRLQDAKPKIGIICVGNTSAQLVADTLIAEGIRYIWNFANVCLTVPEGVIVQREVIAGGLAVLAAKIKNTEAGESAAED